MQSYLDETIISLKSQEEGIIVWSVKTEQNFTQKFLEANMQVKNYEYGIKGLLSKYLIRHF